MLEFMMFMLDISWKILGVVFGFILLKYVIKNGTGAFRDIIETIGIGVRAMSTAIKRKLLNYLKKENAEREQAAN